MFTKRMFVMAFVFTYVGVELSFWSGVYSTCISNTLRIGDNPKVIVALTAICEGLGLFTSIFLNIFEKILQVKTFAGGALIRFLLTKYAKIPRILIVFVGLVIHLVVYTFIFLNLPNESPLDKTNGHGIFKEPRLYFIKSFDDSLYNNLHFQCGLSFNLRFLFGFR